MARRTRSAKRETSAGGVVFRCTDDGPVVLLINDAYKHWGFPKGHVDTGEAPADAAMRETREETGLTQLIAHGPLETIDWYFRFRGVLIHKYCHFFLFESPDGAPTPQAAEGITACRWYTLPEALDTIGYDNARGILQRVGELVPGLCDRGDGPGGR